MARAFYPQKKHKCYFTFLVRFVNYEDKLFDISRFVIIVCTLSEKKAIP